MYGILLLLPGSIFCFFFIFFLLFLMDRTMGKGVESLNQRTQAHPLCVRVWDTGFDLHLKRACAKRVGGGETEKEAQSTQQNEIDKNVDRGQHKNWWILLQHWVKGMLVGGRGWFGVDWIGIGHGCGLLEGREESSFCDSFSFVSWNNWL